MKIVDIPIKVRSKKETQNIFEGKIKHISTILNNDIVNKRNFEKGESKLMSIIKKIIETEEPSLKKSLFKFVNTQKAAEFNAKILKACDYDYEKLLLKQEKTMISYGSEFRLLSKLKNV